MKAVASYSLQLTSRKYSAASKVNINSSSTSFSVLLTHKSLSFGYLSLSFHDVSIFRGNLMHHVIYLYIPPGYIVNLRDQPLRWILWCRAGIRSWNVSFKISLTLGDLFQFQFSVIWSILASILSRIEWKLPSSNWSPLVQATVFKTDAQFLDHSLNSNIAWKDGIVFPFLINMVIYFPLERLIDFFRDLCKVRLFWHLWTDRH